MIRSNLRDLRDIVVRPEDSEAVVKGAVAIGINCRIRNPLLVSQFHYLLCFSQPFDRELNPGKICLRGSSQSPHLSTGSLFLKKGQSITCGNVFTIPMVMIIKLGSP